MKIKKGANNQKNMKAQNCYNICKDIVIPLIAIFMGFVIFGLQIIIQNKISSIDKFETQFPVPQDTRYQIQYISNMVNFLKYNKSSTYRKIATERLEMQANILVEKLHYNKWEESFEPPIYDDGAKGGSNDYRYLVRDTFKKILEVDTNIVKNALFSIYNTSLENRYANVGVLYVFAKLPKCSLTLADLKKLELVLNYGGNEEQIKFYNDLLNLLKSKEKL